LRLLLRLLLFLLLILLELLDAAEEREEVRHWEGDGGRVRGVVNNRVEDRLPTCLENL